MGRVFLAVFFFFLLVIFSNIIDSKVFTNIYPTASFVTDIRDRFSQTSEMTAFLSTTVVAQWYCRCQLLPLWGHLISR